MQRDLIISAEEFLGKKFPDNSSNAYLILSFDGNSKEEVEGYYEKGDRAIDSHIKNLRQKIEIDSRNPKIIQTVYGVGYRFGL